MASITVPILFRFVWRQSEFVFLGALTSVGALFYFHIKQKKEVSFIKKIINLIVLAIMVVLIVILGITGNQQKNQTEETYEAHSGFADQDDLAQAYINHMMHGEFEDVLGLMSKDMIVDIAVENYTSEKDIRNALYSWYRQEYSSYMFSDDGFEIISNPESMFQYTYGMRWEADDELWDTAYNSDYDLGIAGYEYTGLRRLGATEVLFYSAGVFISNEYLEDEVGLYFAIAKIDGLWYLVGID